MEKQKKPIFKKWWFWVIIVLILGGIGSAGGKKQLEETSDSVEASADEEHSANVPEEPAETDIAETEDMPEDETTEASITTPSENFDPDNISILHGEFVEASINDTTLIVKAKISPSYSNKATIDQNYYNVCDIITKQGGDQFDTIDYWAVADMSDGSESKVISFTVSKDIIDLVASGNFPDNTLGDYLDDLWVLPSLTGD